MKDRPADLADRRRQAPSPDTRRSALFVLTLLLYLGAAGCASTAPQPGTGDLAFRLVWTGPADLDLYVISPLGERIHYLRRTAASQGTLDIDCNVGEKPCPNPMENIYWPRDTAPTGEYRVWIVMAKPKGFAASDEYRLLVLDSGTVIWERRGPVSELETGVSPVSLRFP